MKYVLKDNITVIWNRLPNVDLVKSLYQLDKSGTEACLLLWINSETVLHTITEDSHFALKYEPSHMF